MLKMQFLCCCSLTIIFKAYVNNKHQVTSQVTKYFTNESNNILYT